MNEEEYDKFEKKCRKKKSLDFLKYDAYYVKFRIQNPDTYWSQEERNYFGIGKDAHEDVLNCWKRDYKDKNVKLIYVCYV